MLGHAKTILVLLGSWLFLGDQFSPKKLAGMVLAVLGMVLYGKFSMAAKPAPAHAPAKPAPLSPEERKLLIGEGRVSAILLPACWGLRVCLSACPFCLSGGCL